MNLQVQFIGQVIDPVKILAEYAQYFGKMIEKSLPEYSRTRPKKGLSVFRRGESYCLKGVCHEIFDLHFFHDSIQSRPLINRLKYFRIRASRRGVKILV